jgi:phosphoglycerate dehydrogenase-like enzyme
MASPAGSPSIPVPARGVKTTLLVITSKQHVNSDQLTRLTTTNEVLPLEKFDVHVGCAIEDFPEEVLENDNSNPVALLWWFGDAKVMADVLTKPAVQKNIKWMHAASAGVEHLLKEARIANSQTPLTNAKGAFSASLGEWSVFSFLWFNKHANAMRVSQKNKEWTRAPVGMLAGKTVLIAVRNFPNHHVPPPSLPILVPEGTITLTVYVIHITRD